MQKINILGAGQTSMLAAIMLANRGHKVEIIDDKPLKQSHFALLRFKTKNIEEETGIKCEEVEIKKAIFYEGNIYNESNIKFDNLYSQKVTGKIQRRSIGNLGIGKRYIPPADFFQQLEEKCSKLGVLTSIDPNLDLRKDLYNYCNVYHFNETKTISTLPMPNVYKAVCDQEIQFDFEKVYVVEFNLKDCNVHQTIYYPSCIHSVQPAYRISVVGSNIKCEISADTIKSFFDTDSKCLFRGELPTKTFKFESLLRNLNSQIYESFGIEIGDQTVDQIVQDCLFEGTESVIKEQKFGKISPIDEHIRHSIIYNITKQYGIYSLGRFSCWRQIMLDDVVKDVKSIERMIRIENLSSYEAAKNLASSILI